MADCGGAPSVDGEGDRISALPDSIIHHILSLLPSTKEAIRTAILSKRWQYQWTRVPVLIFDFRVESLDSNCEKDFSPFIESSLVLYDCSKVSKFRLEVGRESCQYNRAIRFAVVRNVEELILNFFDPHGLIYKLPKFLFNNPSLVRLETWGCRFVSDLNVNFTSLKVLQIHWGKFGDGVIENVICGSPVLESLDLSNCSGFEQLVIASKSLKSLSVGSQRVGVSLLEIECPKLEKLDLGSLLVLNFRLKSPSLVFGTLNHSPEWAHFYDHSAKRIFEQFSHVLNLRLSGKYVEAALQVGGLHAPLICKSLTLECDSFDMRLSKIAYALRNSHQLENFVIDLRLWETADLTGFIDFEETFWHSNGSGYASLASHLKTAKIIGLSKENHNIEVVLQFVDFLLTNGRALEKVVVILRDGGFKFLAQVSQKLLKVPRCSTLCIVEVLST